MCVFSFPFFFFVSFVVLYLFMDGSLWVTSVPWKTQLDTINPQRAIDEKVEENKRKKEVK
jgi:hypothetical protein